MKHIEANAFEDRNIGLLKTQKSDKGKHENSAERKRPGDLISRLTVLWGNFTGATI